MKKSRQVVNEGSHEVQRLKSRMLLLRSYCRVAEQSDRIVADAKRDQANAFALIANAIAKLENLRHCREQYVQNKTELHEAAELLRLMKKHRIPLRAAKAVRKAVLTGQPLELGENE